MTGECTKILAEVNKCVSTLAVGLVNNLLECLTIMGYEDEAALAMAEGTSKTNLRPEHELRTTCAEALKNGRHRDRHQEQHMHSFGLLRK
eukprot:scaffold674_cov14-Tisochrysis_lutea.AAC.1